MCLYILHQCQFVLIIHGNDRMHVLYSLFVQELTISHWMYLLERFQMYHFRYGRFRFGKVIIFSDFFFSSSLLSVQPEPHSRWGDPWWRQPMSAHWYSHTILRPEAVTLRSRISSDSSLPGSAATPDASCYRAVDRCLQDMYKTGLKIMSQSTVPEANENKDWRIYQNFGCSYAWFLLILLSAVWRFSKWQWFED